jgi:hypothetical protein
MRRTGGCQCGAVRYAVEGELGRPTICHCRMCQKAFGSFFGPFVTVKVAQLAWTRGAPRRFQSSNKIRRGFCEACGTPLTFEWSETAFDVSIGSFDDPTDLKPVIQFALDSALPWVHDLKNLPTRTASELTQAMGHAEGLVSYQHPDHDTESWPNG